MDFIPNKYRKFFRESDIAVDLLIFLSSMFEYKGFAPELRTEFIEYYCSLNPYAAAGVFKTKSGSEVIGYVNTGGTIDAYGIPHAFNINTMNTNSKQGLIDGENGAICWNNKAHFPDLYKIMKFTELLSLVDTSQKCLLRYARLFPIYEVQDDLVKEQIQRALKNADNGDPITYTTKALSKIGVDGTPGVNIINLGDISAVDKIQYLSTYRNDVLRCFYSIYGMSYSQGMKAAQQSIEEIHSDNKVSWILPDDRLNERRKFAESYNKWTKRSASVNYSKAWLDAYKEFTQEGGFNDVNNEMESM
jgi:hypothetical protein